MTELAVGQKLRFPFSGKAEPSYFSKRFQPEDDMTPIGTDEVEMWNEIPEVHFLDST